MVDIAYQLEKFREFFDQEYRLEVLKLEKQRVGEPFLEVDFLKLSKFDSDLASYLLEEPKEIISIAELAATRNEHGKTVEVLFTNLPEQSVVPLNKAADQLEKFLTFEGYVMKPSDLYLKCKSYRAECGSCGNIIRKILLGREWQDITKCGCGRKGRFKVLSKEMTKFQIISLMEAIDVIPEKPRKPITKKVFLEANLTRDKINAQLQPGQRVKIHGFLELEQMKVGRTLSNEFKTNIVANNIIPVKNSWEGLELTKQILKHNKKMAKKPNLLGEFAQSIAPTIEGYEWARVSLILMHVEGKRLYDKNGNLDERGSMSVLLSGNPGTAKSFLARRGATLSPHWVWTTGKGLTAAGLVACVVKDEFDGFTLEVGPLIMADGGSVMLDEIEKMDKEYYGALNNIMAEEETKITKGTVDQTLRSKVAMVCTSNPIHRLFHDNDSIYNQLAPIPKDILDRFDVIWAMREDIDQDKINEKSMDRHIEDSHNVDSIWSKEDMQHYIAQARRITPILNKEMAKYFSLLLTKLTGSTKDDSGSQRLRGNILRWAYAHSKFTGVSKEDKSGKVKVNELDIDFAFNLIKHSFNLLDMISEDGFVQHEIFQDIPKPQEVNTYYAVKNAILDLGKEFNNSVPEDEIIKKVQESIKEFDMDALDKEIKKLKKAGDIFEPNRNKWGVM